MTFESWQLLRIAEAVEREGGRLTVGMLGDLARGLGGASFSAGTGGKGKGKGKASEKVDLDLEAVAAGKVVLSKDVSICFYIYLRGLILIPGLCYRTRKRS